MIYQRNGDILFVSHVHTSDGNLLYSERWHAIRGLNGIDKYLFSIVLSVHQLWKTQNPHVCLRVLYPASILLNPFIPEFLEDSPISESGHLSLHSLNLMYRTRKIAGKSNFSEQFRKLINRYERIGYYLDIMRQTACQCINPITVDGYALLFNCTTAIRASDR